MQPILPLTKVDQVRRAVLDRIFKRTLRPGQRLLEAALASELGVSQATINSALQDLHNQGVVTKLANRSTNVSLYSLRDIEQLFAVRTILEPAAARQASVHLDAQDAADLWEQVDNMLRAAHQKELARFCLADYTFHQLIFQFTRNKFLIQACEAIAAAPFAYILCDSSAALPTDYVALAESHRAVVEALERGPDEAEMVVRNRIVEWRQHSVRALESQGPAALPLARESAATEATHAR